MHNDVTKSKDKVYLQTFQSKLQSMSFALGQNLSPNYFIQIGC